ncbi:unnamed protein product, partial [Boreogadus saida]
VRDEYGKFVSCICPQTTKKYSGFGSTIRSSQSQRVEENGIGLPELSCRTAAGAPPPDGLPERSCRTAAGAPVAVRPAAPAGELRRRRSDRDGSQCFSTGPTA